MGKATRSSVPLDLPRNMQHGGSGYRYGCGCLVCRRWNADQQQKYKVERDQAKQDREDLALANREAKQASGATGKQEDLTRAEIDALGALNDEQASLAHLAMVHAKLIDTIEKEERWHLLNATTRSLRDTMKDLRGTLRTAKPVEEDEDDGLNLRGFG